MLLDVTDYYCISVWTGRCSWMLLTAIAYLFGLEYVLGCN